MVPFTASIAQTNDYDDSDGDEDDDEFNIRPGFSDDYFEDNPEVGDGPWGPQVDACDDEIGCVVEDEHTGDDPLPPDTPASAADDGCEPVPPTLPPPDQAQATEAVTASLGVNPAARGLTGLETWLWVTDPPSEITWSQTGTGGLTEACEELPAPVVTFTAAVDSWIFHLDGEHDSATYSSDTPGTEGDPAATHVFDYVDVYELELAADLRGAINTRVAVDRRDYEVVEVRSRLTE